MKNTKLKPAIAYYRVSTKQQGDSGLGLDAQKSAVQNYAITNGYTIVATYQEVESGRRCDRQQLREALAHAQREGATLVTYKLDRLSRSVLFIATLLEANVDFLVVDMPHASRFSLHLYAAFAEEEARLISQRVRDGLSEAKKRGKKLGASRDGYWDNPKRYQSMIEHLEVAREAASKKKKRQTIEKWSGAFNLIIQLYEENYSLSEIGKQLTKSGYNPPRSKNGVWHSSSVKNLVKLALEYRSKTINTSKHKNVCHQVKNRVLTSDDDIF